MNYRERADAQALEQALNLAPKNPLPLTARSLTAEEVAAIDRRIYPIVFGLYGVGAVGILLFAWFGTEQGDGAVFPIAAIVALVLLVPLGLFARFKAGRRKDYRDPLASIEASADGVTIRSAGRTARLDYRDVVVGEFILLAGAKSRVLFLGVALDGPFGPLRLENMAYQSGTITAAAIVAQRHALGLPVVGRAS
ncbi:MAG: hypothetical protein JWL96_2822 [Sphingomonas bacterium]|uniref:hypothetical protein n=1 Tax=Sphingomonas bacterium TaxID=1895847 RepID=UPI002605D413|nr:hypothetical protein [Sphingomonas bacterium]MDB5710752.1 hypothetical protein [Sphingomonas bacterium]